MSLADAVKALKFVKEDLEKHKAALSASKSREADLQTQVAELKKAAVAPPAYDLLGGLEFEQPNSGSPSSVALQELKEQVSTLMSEKKVLKNHAKSVGRELEDHKLKLSDLNAVVESLQKEKEAMTVQVQVLNTSLQDFTASSQTNDEDMAAKLREKEEELSKVKDMVDSVRKDSAQQWGTRLKAFKEKASIEKKELETKLAEATSASQAAPVSSPVESAGLAKAKKQIEALTAEFIEKDNQFTEANAALAKKELLFEQAKKQIEGGNAAYKKVVQQLEDIKKKFESTSEELEKAKSAADAKDSKIAALTSSASDSDKFISQLAAKDAEIATMNEAVTAKDSEIATLSSSFSDIENTLTSLQSELEQTKSIIAIKDSEIASLTSSVSDNDKFVSQLIAKDAEIASMNEALTTSTSSVASLQSELEQTKSIIAIKDSEVASLKANQEEEIRMMSDLHEKNKKDLTDAIQKECDEVKRVALQDCANASSSASEAEKKLENQSASFALLQGEYEQLKKELAKHSTTSTSHITQLEEAKKMVSVFTGKTQDAEQTIMALRAQLDQASQENTALAKRLERARAESAIKEVKEKVGGVVQMEDSGTNGTNNCTNGAKEQDAMKSLSASLDAAKLDEVAESQQSVSNLVAGLGDKMDGLGDKIEGVVAQVLEKLDGMSVSQAESGSAAAAAASSKVEELESQRSTLHAKCASLETQLAEKEAFAEQAAKMVNDEKARFEALLKAKEDVILSMQREVKEQNVAPPVVDSAAKEELEGELRAAKEDLAKERADKKAIRKAAKGLQATVVDLEGKLKELKENQAKEIQAIEAEKNVPPVKKEKVGSDAGKKVDNEPSKSAATAGHKKSAECDPNCSGCSLDGPGKFLPSSVTSPTPSTSGGWVREEDNHPLPPYGLNSPVILHLLNSWTSDEQKVQYLKMYLQCLTDRTKPIPQTFPKGLTLLGMSKEVKDGFLTLVVPMLRGREDGVEVQVYSRVGVKDKDSEEEEEEEEERGGKGGDEIVYDLKMRILVGSNWEGVGGEFGGLKGEDVKQQQQSAAAAQEAKNAAPKPPNNLKDRIKMRLEKARRASSEGGGATGI